MINPIISSVLLFALPAASRVFLRFPLVPRDAKSQSQALIAIEGEPIFHPDIAPSDAHSMPVTFEMRIPTQSLEPEIPNIICLV